MKILHSRSGESLLEVLVAILIVVAVSSALINSIVISNRINNKIKSYGGGIQYSQETDVSGRRNISVDNVTWAASENSDPKKPLSITSGNSSDCNVQVKTIPNKTQWPYYRYVD